MGQSQTVKSLVQSGEDINQVDDNGFTPLFHAISGNHPDCVKLLLEHDDKDWSIEFAASVFNYAMNKALLLASKHANETKKLKNCNVFELLINKNGMIHFQNKNQVNICKNCIENKLF